MTDKNTGAYSRNDLGAIGTDGVLRDHEGKEILIGLDDEAKAALQERIDGPKVRTAPSERDNYFAAGGTLNERPITYADSQPSGGIDDLRSQAGGKDTKKSEKTNESNKNSE